MSKATDQSHPRNILMMIPPNLPGKTKIGTTTSTCRESRVGSKNSMMEKSRETTATGTYFLMIFVSYHSMLFDNKYLFFE